MATVPELGVLPEQTEPTSSQPSMLADAIQQTKDRQRQDFVSTLQTVSNVSPEKYAQATAVSKFSGIPADVLHDHADQMNQLLKGNKYAAVYDNYRKTAEALKDGSTAAIAQDDIDNLTRIDHASQVTRFDNQSTGEKLWGSVKQAFQSQSVGSDLAYADRLERLKGAFDGVDAEVSRANLAGELPYAAGKAPTGFAYDYLNATPDDRAAMRERLLGRQAGSLADAANTQTAIQAAPVEPGQLRYQELGGDSASAMAQAISENPAYAARTAVGSLATSAPMLAAGALGGPLAAGAVELGTEYDAKLADVLNAAGVNMTDPKAVLTALQDDQLMETARTKASRKALATTAVDVLSMGIAGKLLVPKAIGGKALTAVQREGINLAVQAPVQGVLGGVSEAAGQYAADQKVSGGDVLMEAIAGVGMSSIEVATFGGERVHENISRGLEQSRKARQGKATLDEMVAATIDSKTRERDPETFQAIAENQLKDSAMESISIPADALAKLNQDGKAPVLDDLLARVPGLADQFAEATARGGSVQMKTADYLTAFAEHHEQLANSIRTQVDGMSIEESQAWQDAQSANIEELAKTMQRAPDPVDDAYVSMMGELQQAGYRRADAEQYTALHLSAISTLAQRTGKPLQELLERFPLDVRTKAPESIQRISVDDMRIAIGRLRTGDIPKAGDMFGKSLVEYLRDAGGLDDTGGELAALDTDVGKIGRNRLIKKEGGLSMDDAAMRAWERGYFPGVPREDVGPQLIVDAVQRDLADQPTFSSENENATLRDQAVNLQNLQEYLDQLGVNLNELTDDQVLAVLRNPESVEGVQLNQSGISDVSSLDSSVGEDAQDLISELLDNGATVFPDGRVRVYHRTSDEAAKTIRSTGKMKGAEDGLFFSTKENGEATGFGQNLLTLDIPADQLLLDDAFGDEAHVRIPTDKRGQMVDVGKWITETLNQSGDEKQPRGYISFNSGKNGAQRKFQITVTGRRDLSTLLHEFGHYYLEVVNDLAGDADAPQQMKDDVAAIRAWTGAKESGDFEVDQHEQFARGFEAYLAEGKAPNPDLQGAFSRFKRWIISIYKDLRRLNVELSPEIRGVMDRIVATDEQIRNAEQVTQALPLFENAAKAGMSEEEFQAYRNQIELAHDEAATGVEQQIIREEERRQSKWWAEESARVSAEVGEELDQLPEYQAINALRKGVLPDGTTTNMKLSSAEIKEQYGTAVLRKLSFMHSKNGGAPMDVIASGLSFKSGDEMIKAILGAPPRGEYQRAETAQRMEERHGARSTGEAAERAMSAVHNEKRAAVLLKELHALGKQGNRRNITGQQVLKMAAERIMQERKVRDIQPFEYQRAEGMAGRRAFEAAAKGDLDGAYEAKQQQLLNFHLWNQAKKAREQIDTIVDRMAGFNKSSKREKLGKAGHDYLDQIDAVMEQYEFRNVSLRAIDKRKSFAGWYADQVAQGNDPVVPEFLLNTSQRINYKELSLSQLNELDDFVQNVNHLAGLKNKLTANKRIKDLQEGRQLLARSAFDNVAKRPTRHIVANARSLPEVVGDWLRKGNSSLLKMEQVIEWMDGGDANGAWSTLVFQPLAEAQANRDTMNKDITKRVVDLTNKWFADRGSKAGKIFKVQGLETPMTTNGMLAVALNVGNASNREKLLKGYGWEPHVVDNILANMTKPDWEYVEAMWATVESLWPHIVELEKKVNGVAPPKVEGVKVKTQFGEFQGGYWPLVYDPMSTKYADVEKSLGDLAPLNEKGTVRATPPRGHTQARVDGFAAPILLDVAVIGQHLSGVIHDITHRIPLADAHALIKGEAREAMTQTVGPEMASQFINMLDGIASDQSSGDSKAISATSQVMNALRSNQAAAWMGYSITTMFNQLGGYGQALEYFAQKGGRAHMYKAMIKYWGSPIENGAMIREMSGEMRNRAMNLDASIRDAQRGVLRMKDGRVVQDAFKGMLNARDVMVKYAFTPIQVMQSVVDNVVWMAGYEMEGGAMNHDQAVHGADRAVRLTQTAGGAKDQATIQQSNLAKLFMPVYGYASLLWNRNLDIAKSAGQGIKQRSPQQVLVAFERFIYLNIVPALLSGLIKGALPGQSDDEEKPDDKKESWSHFIAVQSLLGVSSGIPLVGGLAQGFFGDYGYAGASAIGQGFDAGIKAYNSEKGKTIATQAIAAAGAFTGLPASQINRAVRTGFMLEDGELDDSAAAVVRGVLFGPPTKK